MALYIGLYATYDFQGLRPLILNCALAFLASAVAPLTMRFGIVFSSIWVSVAFFGVVFGNSYLASSASGLHFALGPIMAMYYAFTLGTKRLFLMLSLSFVATATMVYADLFFVDPAPWVRVDDTILASIRVLLLTATAAATGFLILYAMHRVQVAENALQNEFKKSERLLKNVLPKSVAERLRGSLTRLLQIRYRIPLSCLRTLWISHPALQT